jgi:predicted HTH domain antitoxin
MNYDVILRIGWWALLTYMSTRRSKMNHRTLTQRVNVLVEQGIFEDEERLKNMAYRSLLTLRPELKVEIALSLYKSEQVSLGRAAEIAGLSREELKEIMASRGIERKISSLPQGEVDAGVKRLLKRG